MELGDKPLNYHGCAWDLDKDDDRHPRYAQQRSERGFDDTETWSLDSTIAAFILPRLKRFKEVNPCDWFWDEGEEKGDKTDDVLDKMIAAFQYIVDSNFSFEVEPDYVQEGMQLFALYFRKLWW